MKLKEQVVPEICEITEVTLTKWLKKIGDEVDVGEALFEVSTDKVDIEIPVSIAGTLATIEVQEGSVVSIGMVACTIEESKCCSLP